MGNDLKEAGGCHNFKAKCERKEYRKSTKGSIGLKLEGERQGGAGNCISCKGPKFNSWYHPTQKTNK